MTGLEAGVERCRAEDGVDNDVCEGQKSISDASVLRVEGPDSLRRDPKRTKGKRLPLKGPSESQA